MEVMMLMHIDTQMMCDAEECVCGCVSLSLSLMEVLFV